MTGDPAAVQQRDFAARYGRWALIAGASDGIGEAFAHEAAGRGLNVVLLARRAELLADVAADVAAEHGVQTRCVVVDLTSPEMCGVVALEVAELEVGLLVYNAGAVHGAGRFLDAPLHDVTTLIDLNCRGPVALAHLLGRPMRERGRGGMIFMSSMSALAGSAYVAAYAATKSFDVIIAEALWQELQGDGIDVLGVLAGATETPSMLRSLDTFALRDDLQQPADVAREAFDGLGRGPTCVPGERNRAAAAYLWPRSRVELSGLMSAATAQMYDLPPTAAEGRDFGDAAGRPAPGGAP